MVYVEVAKASDLGEGDIKELIFSGAVALSLLVIFNYLSHEEDRSAKFNDKW